MSCAADGPVDLSGKGLGQQTRVTVFGPGRAGQGTTRGQEGRSHDGTVRAIPMTGHGRERSMLRSRTGRERGRVVPVRLGVAAVAHDELHGVCLSESPAVRQGPTLVNGQTKL